jgi:hypothetical protein
MKKLILEEIIEKFKKLHDNKYDYSLVDYVNNKTKVKIICSTHNIFEQTPNSHLKGSGCPKCGFLSSGKKRKFNTINFINKTNLIHGDKYDYSLVDYNHSETKIKIICPIHGEFEQTPKSHLNNNGCPSCVGLKKLNSKTFINKSELIHGDKYDYSLVDYVNNKTKVKIICKEHGNFEQIPSNHLKGQGCSKCCGKFKSNNNDFINKSELIHGDKYDYSLVNYVNNKTKIKIICPIHNIFEQTPNSHLNGNGCPICNESKGEKEIRRYLIENKIKFIPQYKFDDCINIKPLPFDFYLPDYDTCIEYDGRQHTIPINFFGGINTLLELKKRDKIKTEYAFNKKMRLIRLNYDEDINETLNKKIKNGI